MSQVSKFQKFFCSLFYFMIILLSMQKIREKDKICKFWYLPEYAYLRLFWSYASFRTYNTVNTVFCTFLLHALTY